MEPSYAVKSQNCYQSEGCRPALGAVLRPQLEVGLALAWLGKCACHSTCPGQWAVCLMAPHSTSKLRITTFPQESASTKPHFYLGGERHLGKSGVAAVILLLPPDGPTNGRKLGCDSGHNRRF